jgi:hypothetical protein
MARRLTLAACALALLAAAPATAARKPRCRLAGTNLAHSRTIKVVSRTVEDESIKLLGCVKPDGRVRTLAEGVSSFTTETSLSVVSVSGTWVAIRSGTSNQYGGDLAWRSVDVNTGKGYPVASERYMLGEPYVGQAAAALAVNARGFTAAVVDDLAPGTGTNSTVTKRSVVLVDRRGNPRALDSGPPSELDPGSLILDAHTVLWARAGLVRYARF